MHIYANTLAELLFDKKNLSLDFSQLHLVCVNKQKTHASKLTSCNEASQHTTQNVCSNQTLRGPGQAHPVDP